MKALMKWVTSCAVAFGTVALLLTAGYAQAQVGMTRLQLAGMEVTLVYPTAIQASTHAFGPISVEVALDAPLADGPTRNLVVMSHGTGGDPLADHGMAAAFVRAGLVAAQIRHAGDNARDASHAGPDAFKTRPKEVSQLLDALALQPTWRDRVHLDGVGVHGMSAGGVTALSLAGAQWRLLSLVQHCLKHSDDDAGFCFNGEPDPDKQAKRRAQFERARNVPESYLPAELTTWNGGRNAPSDSADADSASKGLQSPFDPRPDTRIVVATAVVPVAAIFSADSLARIRIPVGIVIAEGDQMLNPQYHACYVLDHCQTCSLLASLPGATHMDMLEPWPATLAAKLAETQPFGAATNPTLDPALRTTAFEKVAAFHRQHLFKQ